MDPDAALKRGMSLADDGEDERLEAILGLRQWIERGGWLPTAWRGLSRIDALAACDEMKQ
tara:strand:- start:9824 stop:10003 length:180 start_codon:yes stop_codon:yes gene_type:complete